MFDTVNFTLRQDEVSGVDFLGEMPNYLDDTGEHIYEGNHYITGRLEGYKVTVGSHQVKVTDHSLCKFLFGNNYQTMGRKDTGRAIEKLSDLLHVPMQLAAVTRLDVAQNFIMQHPVEVYLSHLGQMKGAKRLPMDFGLYYKMRNEMLCLYDKNKEQDGGGIPELYRGRNVLRIEQRYKGRIARRLGCKEVTGGTLSDSDFYTMICKRWGAAFQEIQKINELIFNFEKMSGKKELYRLGVLALVERAGGQNALFEQIREAQKTGKLKKEQAFCLRKAVEDACKIETGFAVQSDVIAELNKKVGEAVRCNM